MEMFSLKKAPIVKTYLVCGDVVSKEICFVLFSFYLGGFFFFKSIFPKE